MKAKSLLEQFNQKNKDYIFLVNEEVKPSYREEENLIENKVQKTLQLIFDEKIESNDRISLMTFKNKRTKVLFNLVGIQKNMTQLKN